MKNIIVLLLLIVGLSAKSATYYIDPSGNDGTGNGSIGTPWKTLAYACSQVTTSGNTIHVNAGTYNETARCNLSVGVSIEGVGDASYIVSFYYLSSYDYGAISLYSSTAGTDGNQSISYIKLDGNNLTSYIGINVRYRSNVKIHHCTVVDFILGGISFSGDRVQSTLSSAGTDPSVYQVGNEIHDCTITNCSAGRLSVYDPEYVGTGAAIIHHSQDGLLVYDNTLTQDSRTNGNNGNLISAWGGHDKNVKYYRNIFRKPLIETDQLPKTTWNFCMEIGGVRGGVEIYDNEFWNGVGVDLASYDNLKGSSTYSCWIHDNLFTADRPISMVADDPNNIYYAMTIEGGNEDVIISNNYIKDKPAGISLALGQTPRTFKNIYIYNNVEENIGYSDGGWLMANAMSSYSTGNIMQNVYWDNNTITTNNSYGAFYIKSNDRVDNVYFRNNIVKNTSTGFGYGWIVFWDTAGEIDSIYLQNNLVYNYPNSNNPYYRNSKTVTNLTESGTIKSDPLFISTSDFRLQSSSPGINTGIDVGLTTDYLGSSISGLPDIGAYEYQPPGTSTTKVASTTGGRWVMSGNKVVVP